MGAHSPALQSGIKNIAMMQPIGFTHETFHAVAVHCMLEKSFGDTDNQLVFIIFFC